MINGGVISVFPEEIIKNQTELLVCLSIVKVLTEEFIFFSLIME